MGSQPDSQHAQLAQLIAARSREHLRAAPVRPVLEQHGIDVGTVVAALGGRPPSALTRRSGLLSLDHLDS
ncbi:hypothetical protein [Streptomyces paromomycinus]|uniref:Uncharacterized protein n=1 Tax=Streptomyces paromomycinus TaxID=92743 RepID=A0A401VV74_STREY|nr:hypothetical protein [Streptomyces paromomycinus]GCD40975.1 hypothetical protein GKJPGBOP_00628 [Streptomyces paromomycinus]